MNKQIIERLQELTCHTPQILTLLWQHSHTKNAIFNNGFLTEIRKISSLTVGNHRNLQRWQIKIKMTAFWDIAPCSLVEIDVSERCMTTRAISQKSCLHTRRMNLKSPYIHCTNISTHLELGCINPLQPSRNYM
jgi:hypothetical protein